MAILCQCSVRTQWVLIKNIRCNFFTFVFKFSCHLKSISSLGTLLLMNNFRFLFESNILAAFYPLFSLSWAWASGFYYIIYTELQCALRPPHCGIRTRDGRSRGRDTLDHLTSSNRTIWLQFFHYFCCTRREHFLSL